MSRKVRAIALYGPFGWGNLGDAAIQEAMIHNVRLRLPHVQFLGISLNPDNTEAIHGIPSVPIVRGWTRRPAPATAPAPGGATALPPSTAGPVPDAAVPSAPAARSRPPLWRRVRALGRPAMELLRELRFAARAVGTLRRVDVLAISGGGQISDDWGGPWDHPYSLLKWMLCARLAGARVYVVSVGAGPIRKPMSGRLLHAALRLAHSRSYRDVGSSALLRPWGFTRRDAVFPDLAFSLPSPAAGANGPAAPADRAPGSGRPLVVGVSPMAYCYPKAGPWPEQDRGRYDRYLGTLADFAAGMLASGRRVSVVLSQIRNDRYALDDLVRALDARGLTGDDRARLHVEPTSGLQHLLAQIALVDIVVTSRLHGVILSYLLHKPVIALSYDPKIRAVMEQFERTEDCLDIEQVTAASLRERLEHLTRERQSVAQHIARTAAAHRARLDEQYDRLFGPRAGATGS